MKKGFTLIELLAVIIILAVIALIATPIVLNVVDSAKESARQSSVAGYADAMKLGVSDYMFQNQGDLPAIDAAFQEKYKPQGETVTCEEVYSTDKYGIVLSNCTVGSDTTKYCFAKGLHYACDDVTYIDMLEYAKSRKISYKDKSGANQPLLLDKMIPVKYDGANWVYANTTQEWYDYDKKEWANAIVLKSGVTKTVGQTIAEDDIALWYVWIPRYKYTIFNGNNEGAPVQEIKVTFENGTSKTGTVTCTDSINGTGTPSSSETCTDSTNGSIKNGISTYTHPAFTFGDKELTGIWVGKFENSTTDSACLTTTNETTCNKNTHKIEIKPNVHPLRYATISNFFTSIQNIKTNYGITNGDSHMMKNMEWGAVAYLKQSKYGLGTTNIGINNNSDFITGCGTNSDAEKSTICNTYNTTDGKKASTTGNIYGIYDMSGGTWEYVMGNMVNSSNEFSVISSEFNSPPESKYYDSYTYDGFDTSQGRGKLGDATKETLITSGSNTGGWNNDYTGFVYSNKSWFVRSGHYGSGSYTGVFYFSGNIGHYSGDAGSRSVLVLE